MRPPIIHYCLNESVYMINLIDPNRPKIIDNNTETDVNSLNATIPQCSRMDIECHNVQGISTINQTIVSIVSYLMNEYECGVNMCSGWCMVCSACCMRCSCSHFNKNGYLNGNDIQYSTMKLTKAVKPSLPKATNICNNHFVQWKPCCNYKIWPR